MTESSSTRRELASGVRVHGWAPASPVGIVVVQHGYGEYARRFVGQHGRFVPRLLDAGFEVWAMDLWGHGESPGLRGVASVRRAVRDHVEMRAAADGRDLPVLLFGHSLGGLVTAGSVVADGDDIAGVVLSGAAFPSEPRLVRRVLGAAATRWPHAPIPVPRSPLSGLSHDPEVVLRAAADDRMTCRQVPLLLAATAIDVMDDIRSRASAWTAPTLVLHGTDDVYTDPAASEALVDALASRDKTLRRVPGGRHELLHDTGGDALVDDVIGWMTARSRVWRGRSS